MSRCLLIVDVQRGFINEHTMHIPTAVEAVQNDYDFVVATRFYNAPDSLFRSLIRWHRLGRDSKEFELAFEPRADAQIIDKPTYSCITADFLGWLGERSIERVEICGIDLDICVTKCAVDLFDAGVEPVVLADLCATHNGSVDREASLKTLRRFIGAGQVR